MRFNINGLSQVVSIAIIVFLAVSMLLPYFIINVSHSLPEWIFLKTNQDFKKGVAVMFCPPDKDVFRMAVERKYLDHGYCATGGMPFLKEIAAVSGDVVTINKNGVYVNNSLIDNSAPVLIDSKNHKMPRLYVDKYSLKENEFLFMGRGSKKSFDARYYGILNLRELTNVATATPIF